MLAEGRLGGTSTRSSPPFRPDIEGIRAIAVIAVVGFHYGVPGMKGGFVGVDIFFAISGYLITGLLVAEVEGSGKLDFSRFYGRRARRLLPAALLVCLTTLIVTCVFLAPLEQLSVIKAAAASSLYFSNFWFLHQSFGYFAPESALNPFLHTWSLAVEEQFYFLWPALLSLIARPKWRVALLSPVLLGLTLGSLALCLWLTAVKQPWAFYALPSRAWEFGTGAIASISPLSRLMARGASGLIVGWIGAIGLIVSCLIRYDIRLFPGPEALLAVVATVLVLVSGADGAARGRPAAVLCTGLFQWFGRHSYSIYLWHWPILVLTTTLRPDLGTWGRVCCIVLTLVCAAISFSFLEKPIRSNRWLGAVSNRSLALAGVLTLSGGGMSLAAWKIASAHAQRGLQGLISIQTDRAPIASGSGQGCLVGFTVAQPVVCAFGSSKASKTFVLFGDSHADQWSTPLILLAQRHHWRIVTFLKSSCSVATIPVYNYRLNRFSPECDEWRASSMAQIIALKPDAVVIGEFSSGYVLGPLSTLGANAVDVSTWRAGLRRSIATFEDAGIDVFVLRDSPTPVRNIRNCLAQADWDGKPLSVCDTPRSSSSDAEVVDAERSVTLSFPKAQFIDLSSNFCDAVTCPAFRDGLVVYRDGNHLTTDYAGKLVGPLEKYFVE